VPGGLFNGNINGSIWRNAGSIKQRAYGYSYDNANRLLASDFTEKQTTTSSFANADGIDCSTKMGDGVNYGTAYDANGNILRMQHKAFLINSGTLSGSSLIDDLRYTYYTQSNKLKNVVDMITNTPTNTYGDFYTNNNSINYSDHYNLVTFGGNANSIIDYTYDVNGNLKKDENKLINTINYNYLNLPQNVSVTNTVAGGNNTVSYVYDAAGNKLQKIVTELMAQDIFYSNQFYNSNITTTTSYIAGAVYETKQYSEPALAPPQTRRSL
jgi:hypothetical protein